MMCVLQTKVFLVVFYKTAFYVLCGIGISLFYFCLFFANFGKYQQNDDFLLDSEWVMQKSGRHRESERQSSAAETNDAEAQTGSY